MAIVDMPLYQRLQFIRQLGPAFLVYPSLGYSRFEHSLGVVAQLKQVIAGIAANLREEVSRIRRVHTDTPPGEWRARQLT